MTVTEEMKKARRKAMSLLEHMDRTEKGLSERLRQAGFSAEAAEDAMNYVRGKTIPVSISQQSPGCQIKQLMGKAGYQKAPQSLQSSAPGKNYQRSTACKAC